jgi:hypothetical protein
MKRELGANVPIARKRAIVTGHFGAHPSDSSNSFIIVLAKGDENFEYGH